MCVSTENTKHSFNNNNKIIAGCDIILNSLADDKMTSSLRLLAKHGRFLEIGKYDLMQNTPLGNVLDTGLLSLTLLKTKYELMVFKPLRVK